MQNREICTLLIKTRIGFACNRYNSWQEDRGFESDGSHFNINLFKKRYLSFFSKSGISLSIIRIFLIVIPIFNIDVSIISQSYMHISLYRNRIARKGKNRCCEILFQTAFYLNVYFICILSGFFKTRNAVCNVFQTTLQFNAVCNLLQIA